MILSFKKGLALFLIVLSLAILSCVSPSEGDTASISITLNNVPGKAVSLDQLRHVITLSGPTGSQTFNINGVGSVKAIVAAGLWLIDVKAFYGTELYAVGSGSAEVRGGQTTDVLIYMTVVWSEPVVPVIKPPPPSYYFITTDYDLFTFITLTARTRAVVPDGNYDYNAQLLGAVISSGTATVSNGLFTFLASDGDTFDYDATVGLASGSITLTPAKMAEIETAVGMGPLTLPSILNIDYMTGVEKGGGGNYWDGTWIRESEDGTLLTQQIIFNGANYTLSDGTNTESGTFTYNDPLTATSPNTEQMLVFFRPGNNVAIYKWEGMADDPIVGDNFIELYNWTIDPMGVALNDNGVSELFDDLLDVVTLYSVSPWDIGSPYDFGGPYDTAWDAYKTAYDANPRMFRKQ